MTKGVVVRLIRYLEEISADFIAEMSDRLIEGGSLKGLMGRGSPGWKLMEPTRGPAF